MRIAVPCRPGVQASLDLEDEEPLPIEALGRRGERSLGQELRLQRRS
jgi:hypothetical protein